MICWICQKLPSIKLQATWHSNNYSVVSNFSTRSSVKVLPCLRGAGESYHGSANTINSAIVTCTGRGRLVALCCTPCGFAASRAHRRASPSCPDGPVQICTSCLATALFSWGKSKHAMAGYPLPQSSLMDQ